MANNCVIGIDLGGTNCRAGVVNAEGQVLAQIMRPVGQHRSADTLLQFLVSLIDELRSSPAPSPQPLAVGVGAPGIIRQPGGVIERSPHFPQLKQMPLAADLQSRLGLPVYVDNDVNAIAIGEGWLGAAAQWQNFLMLTFGTGIGGAIVIDQKVFRGDCGFAGEVGHFVIHADGPPCPCGSAGCWELYASASGVYHYNRETRDPAQWKVFGAYVGAGIASLVNIMGINHVVIGGGLAGAWDFFIGEAERTIRKRTYQETAAAIVLKRSVLGDAAGIIGAARLALHG